MVCLRAYGHIVPPPGMKYRNRKARQRWSNRERSHQHPREASVALERCAATVRHGKCACVQHVVFHSRQAEATTAPFVGTLKA